MRKVIKLITNKPEKFIPKTHSADTELSEDNTDIMKRPMVFMVRKLTRDEQFRIREMIDFKDNADPNKGIYGSGDVAKYIWQNCVTEVKNVVISENGELHTYESVIGKQKDELWNTDGMDSEIAEAILFARLSSELSEAEAKN